MEWSLLEKTTFWVDDVELEGADLDRVASAAAGALGMEDKEVMVVDVRPGFVAFDVLRRQVGAEMVAGKEKEILARLREMPGVRVGSGAGVHSEGVLGFIAMEPEEAARVLEESGRLAESVARAVSRRALVFASGSEVIEGKIKDTNSPHIITSLQDSGYRADFGGILEDDVMAVAVNLEAALERGYGLIVTTGGVGAEDKDFTVEAICRLDPGAHTPWILKFKPDFHRHHKEGVRIAVGSVGLARLVALPGPHEEARIGCARLLEGLRQGLDGIALAEYIAAALRERWCSMMHKGGIKHGH